MGVGDAGEAEGDGVLDAGDESATEPFDEHPARTAASTRAARAGSASRPTRPGPGRIMGERCSTAADTPLNGPTRPCVVDVSPAGLGGLTTP
jgi:hypothetical protein